MPVAVLNNGTFNGPLFPWPGDPAAGYVPVGFNYAPGYPGGHSDIAGAALTDGSGITIQSNTTYSYYKNLGLGVIGSGSPMAPVHNVTFNGCCWEGVGYPFSAIIVLAIDGPCTFNYCTVRPTGLTDSSQPVAQTAGYEFAFVGDGTQANPGSYNSFVNGALTLSYCDMWGMADGSKIENLANPLTYSYTWVHQARVNTSGVDHTDGLGLAAGGTASNVTIDHCRVESIGDTQGLSFQNSPGPSTFSNFTITNNLFGGWGNTICVINGSSPGTSLPPTNITFTDNTFSTALQCFITPLYSALMSQSAQGNLWRRNKWHVPPGAFWGNPAHDGLFWMPVGNTIQGTDDTPFVSVTDFTG